MFDWQEFLGFNRIEYVTRGPSTSKGNLYVHCPFCGEADAGHHMGVSIKGKGWGCWRDASHRGIAPARLVQALLGCGWEEAARIVGRKAHNVPGSDLLSRVHAALGGKPFEAPVLKPPTMPASFRSMVGATKTPHYRYLRQERGYSAREIEHFVDEFGLRYCWHGERQWAWRIIIPVVDAEQKLLTWTGRHVGGDPLRYRTLTCDVEKASSGPVARAAINDGFLRHRKLERGAEILVLVEGPFDCMMVDSCAGKFDIHVDCLFGKVLTTGQMDYLVHVRDKYRNVFLVLDPEAGVDALRMGPQLGALGVEPYLLKGHQDPGEMSADKIRRMLAEMEKRVCRAP